MISIRPLMLDETPLDIGQLCVGLDRKALEHGCLLQTVLGKNPPIRSPRKKSPRKKKLASFFCSYVLKLASLVLGLRTLVGTGSRSTAFKRIFLGGFYLDTLYSLQIFTHCIIS